MKTNGILLHFRYRDLSFKSARHQGTRWLIPHQFTMQVVNFMLENAANQARGQHLVLLAKNVVEFHSGLKRSFH